MSTHYTSTVEVDEVLSLGLAQGQAVAILEGTAWVTQGDERDLILEAGATIDLDGPGEALITALQARVVVEVSSAVADRLAA